MDELPEELQARIVGFLDRKSLAQTRLVSRRLERLSVENLFHRVTLYAHWKALGKYESFEVGIYDDGGGDPSAGYGERMDIAENEDHEMSQATDAVDGEQIEIDRDGANSEASEQSFDDTAMTASQMEQYKKEWQQKGLPPVWAVEGLPGPRGYDARVFRNILEDEKLREYVKEVQVYTCETHCDHHPATLCQMFGGFAPTPNFDPIYHECIKRLGEFKNMQKLIVNFDRHAGDYEYDDILQGGDFQKRWLTRILRALNGHPTELAIRNYENFKLPDDEASNFISSVANATSLRMSIKHGETHPDGGPTYRRGDIHDFWDRFPSQLLEPPRDKLTALVLYSDLPLGWFPKLDLRSVHFPKLRSLTFGQHIFHANHQVDWIISHRGTLQKLYLDHCSILYQIGHSIRGWLDDDGYPRARPPGNPAEDYGWSLDPVMCEDRSTIVDNMRFKSYSMRWHTVLLRFAEELHNLYEFRFGSSEQWDFDVESRYVEEGGGSGNQHPIMPWEDEQNIKNRILEHRYVVWDDWDSRYRPNWKARQNDVDWEHEWKTRFEPYPDCREDDEAALKTLLDTIKGR